MKGDVHIVTQGRVLIVPDWPRIGAWNGLPTFRMPDWLAAVIGPKWTRETIRLVTDHHV